MQQPRDAHQRMDHYSLYTNFWKSDEMQLQETMWAIQIINDADIVEPLGYFWNNNIKIKWKIKLIIFCTQIMLFIFLNFPFIENTEGPRTRSTGKIP